MWHFAGSAKFHASAFREGGNACLDRTDLFTDVRPLHGMGHQHQFHHTVKCASTWLGSGLNRGCVNPGRADETRRSDCLPSTAPCPTTSILAAALSTYALGAGITEASGTRLAHPWQGYLGCFGDQSIQTVPSCKAQETQLTFFVAASVEHDYGASCGPAARHSARSHVPCSFSGIEPISPVTVVAMADHYHAI